MACIFPRMGTNLYIWDASEQQVGVNIHRRSLVMRLVFPRVGYIPVPLHNVNVTQYDQYCVRVDGRGIYILARSFLRGAWEL